MFPKIAKNRHYLLDLLDKKSTPFFTADKSILLKRYRSFPPSFTIAYSFKTNYNVAKTKIFLKLGSWAEVVSGREYRLAIKLGYPPPRIIFNGPFKKDSEIRLAVKNKSLLHLDNPNQLDQLISLQLPPNSNIGLRLNLRLPHLNPSRFGFSLENHEARSAISTLIQHRLPPQSLHLHLGTDISNPRLYSLASQKVVKLVNQLKTDFNIRLKYLDFGGGFPSHGLPPLHSHRWHYHPIKDYFQAITTPLGSLSATPSLILEPGRFLVDDAVIFITKVISQKTNRRHQTLTTDSTINMLPLLWYRPPIIKSFSPQLLSQSKPSVSTTIYGASCQESDILFRGRLPPTNLNDYLIFFCTGAYNQNLTPDFIFNQPAFYCL